MTLPTAVDNEANFAPSPSRLAEGLRDTGYSHESAFADIVDNSIAANATQVDIDIYLAVDSSLNYPAAKNNLYVIHIYLFLFYTSGSF